MKQRLLAVALAGGLMVSFAGGALADAKTNGTTNDAIGYCVSNHNKNHKETITTGESRRNNGGEQAGVNAEIREEGSALNTLCTETQTPGE